MYLQIVLFKIFFCSKPLANRTQSEEDEIIVAGSLIHPTWNPIWISTAWHCGNRGNLIPCLIYTLSVEFKSLNNREINRMIDVGNVTHLN